MVDGWVDLLVVFYVKVLDDVLDNLVIVFRVYCEVLVVGDEVFVLWVVVVLEKVGVVFVDVVLIFFVWVVCFNDIKGVFVVIVKLVGGLLVVLVFVLLGWVVFVEKCDFVFLLDVGVIDLVVGCFVVEICVLLMIVVGGSEDVIGVLVLCDDLCIVVV